MKKVGKFMVVVVIVLLSALALYVVYKKKIDISGNLNGLEYNLNSSGNSYSVVGIGKFNETELDIPKEYNGKPVTSIESGAINSERDFRKTQQKTPNKIENSLQMIA